MISRGDLDLTAYLNKFLRTNKPEQHTNTFWTDKLPTETEKQAIEDILVDYHDIFATHRIDIGLDTDFKVKVTPKDDKAVYSQNLTMPIHLKEDLIVESALMHKYEITTVLTFSKYASHIFAQRKPSGKLRLFFGSQENQQFDCRGLVQQQSPS